MKVELQLKQTGTRDLLRVDIKIGESTEALFFTPSSFEDEKLVVGLFTHLAEIISNHKGNS